MSNQIKDDHLTRFLNLLEKAGATDILIEHDKIRLTLMEARVTLTPTVIPTVGIHVTCGIPKP